MIKKHTFKLGKSVFLFLLLLLVQECFAQDHSDLTIKTLI